jgi:hypothetical protein
MNLFTKDNFVRLNYVKVRLWFSKLMHLNQRKQKRTIKKIYNDGVLNTKQVDQLSDMLKIEPKKTTNKFHALRDKN